MKEVFGFDCYSPKEIAERIENVGVTKAALPLLSQVALGVLAGGFIGLGAMFFTLVVSDASLSFAVARVLGGVVFSLGLILVVVAGAELFTGNNLLVMATVAGRIPASIHVEGTELHADPGTGERLRRRRPGSGNGDPRADAQNAAVPDVRGSRPRAV